MIGILALAANGIEDEEPFDSLPPGVWRNARVNGLVTIRRPAPSPLSGRTQIAGKDAGVAVYAYNTDAQGCYGENHAEYPQRLYGWMKTDAEGRFELRTILPGWYPEMHVPAHIHFHSGERGILFSGWKRRSLKATVSSLPRC